MLGGYYQPQPPPNTVYVQQQDQNRGGDHNCCMACLIGCLACCALESLCDMCCWTRKLAFIKTDICFNNKLYKDKKC